MRRPVLYGILILLVAAGVFYSRFGSRGSVEGDEVASRSQRAPGGAVAQEDQRGSRLMGNRRNPESEPTIDETMELLRTTIIPVVDMEDETLREIIPKLNLFLREAGVGPDQLRMTYSDFVAGEGRSALDWRFGELRLREVPVGELLRYIADSTQLRFRVSEGLVEFTIASDVNLQTPVAEDRGAETPADYDPTDPFAPPVVGEPER